MCVCERERDRIFRTIQGYLYPRQLAHKAAAPPHSFPSPPPSARPTMLKLALRLVCVDPSTLERERARAHQKGEPNQPETELDTDWTPPPDPR